MSRPRSNPRSNRGPAPAMRSTGPQHAPGISTRAAEEREARDAGTGQPRHGAARPTHPNAPLLAIVGRPNVGKSTLYNRLVGGRPALVHDTPGLTRDRRYGEIDYFGRYLRVVDTGGLDPEAQSEVIGAGIHRQAMRAIEEASALMLVVDLTAGLNPVDQLVASKLRATGKPVFIAANKADHAGRDEARGEFFALGLGDPFPISAAHGRGIDALVEAIVDELKVPREAEEADNEAERPYADEIEKRTSRAPVRADDYDYVGAVANLTAEDPVAYSGEDDEYVGAQHDADVTDAAVTAADIDADNAARDRARGIRRGPLRVAFVGKPNAGKSSLTNRLVGEERSLVHDQPGTTTDPVDTPFELGGRKYILVDTAGVRRKAKVEDAVEKIAVSMSIGQIERADVVVLVVDSEIGISEQDARLAGMVADAGRALIVALNKSDLVRGSEAKEKLLQSVEDTFHFLSWVPVHQMSAARGDGVDRLMDLVDQVASQFSRRITTAQLNRFFSDVCGTTPPPLYRGRSVRVSYLTQGQVRPPTFLLFANQPEGLSPQYRRFVINQLRATYGFHGTPLRVVVKSKDGVAEEAAAKPSGRAAAVVGAGRERARAKAKAPPRRTNTEKAKSKARPAGRATARPVRTALGKKAASRAAAASKSARTGRPVRVSKPKSSRSTRR